MIKTLVFDFGQVLVRFEPDYMVRVYVRDEEDAALLSEVVFDRLYWDRLDAGTITNEEVMDACKARLPKRLHADAEKIYYNWIYNIPEIEGMRELIVYAKEKYGVRVLVLSNISRYFAEHREEIPILGLADGAVLSAEIGITKPDEDIFRHLCDTFSLIPEETIFIDDNENNCNGAKALGINAYRFDGDAERLKSYLDGILTDVR